MSQHLFGQYLNAPVNRRYDNRFLCDVVIPFIGKKYGNGKGSNFAKGKRYLKSQIPECKSDHIKLMLSSVSCPIRDKDNDNDDFMFRFSINSYVKLFAKIVEIMVNNHASFSDDIKKEIPSIQSRSA